MKGGFMRLWTVRVVIVMSLVLMPVAGGCGRGSDKPSDSHNAPATDQPFIKKNENPLGTIVFVHGVLGAGRATWTHPQTSAFFPQLVADHPSFKGFDVYVHEYSSPKLGTALSIDELADNLRLMFDVHKISESPQIIFAAHSMGGLVTRALLAKYQHLGNRTKFIYFYATPTTGSELATFATLLSKNPQIGGMLPMESEGYLANLQRAWLAADFPTRSYCAYERQPTAVGIVVKQASASNLCTKRLDPIDRDHMGIVKPESANDLPFLVFLSAFEEQRKQAPKAVSAPPGTALGAMLKMIVEQDHAGYAFDESCNSARQRVLSDGNIQGITYMDMMNIAATRVGDPRVRLDIKKVEGIYEIKCS